MKDWRDQLRDIKRTLREADTSEKHGDKPSKVDFVPPESWLKDDSTDHQNPSHRGTSTQPSSSRTLSHTAVPRPRSAPAGGRPERLPVAPTPAASAPAFHPRIDGSQRLSMPAWAGVGKALQHPETRGGAPLLVRFGLDFGTAFTKVALRIGPDLVTVDWFPVTGDNSPAGRWTVPAFVCRGSDGEFGWRRFEDGEWQGNLKLPLVEHPGSASCPYSALAYLAEVIRYSRAFLYRHPEVGRKLAHRSLRWELNLGCPTEPHENLEIVERFVHVARTAWWLAGSDDLDEVAIRAGWERRDLETGLETQPGVVPEFVAQIAGYLKSPHVTEGLHALVDVGAATLDVATFNLVLPKQEPVPRIPIFFSAVKPLGTHFLAYERYATLGLELVWNDATPIEAPAEFAYRHGKDVSEVELVDAGFASRVASCIADVINATRISVRGDPRNSAWREGLPVFVTGGGASCETYGRAIRESETKLKGRLRSNGHFRFIAMDLFPVNSIDVDPAAAVRLTVAIGLTEDAEDIARIVPHRDIEPISKMVDTPRPDRDELYPK